MKHVQACLSGWNDQESSFHRCGGPVKLVQATLRARKDLGMSFTTVEVVGNSCKHVYVRDKSDRAHNRSCEARASLFKCQS